ncbi:sensor histidine kinase [Amaricoccus solimangrovi]|uniref:histidine kinase n=1 Tax=Amaricoccus solimangrovi TaxID=2589815 RepID=A0A501WKJ6_9RHOB|nr:HAMP domain-containing sensor histidine kinase [Amaricoccus solimangrovi]TPE47697.1 HAMP domain-containing histidine kinase [Amaricoccus solimangrovi]
MSGGSIRLRLLLAGAAAILAALALAAVGLRVLFERHVERRAYAEMLVDLDQLAAGLSRAPDGSVTVTRPPSDPRFARPLSGSYWQVETDTGGPSRSRSLWDGALDLPDPAPPPGTPREDALEGPGGATLLLLERTLTLAEGGGVSRVRTAVALDRSEVRAATRAFVGDLAPYVALLAAMLIAAGAAQVAVGLRPLAKVGERVAAVRSGEKSRLGADFPREIRPLAAEVDALIAEREEALLRARGRSADLAHGLKSPLQALIGEADRLRAKGERAEAEGIEEIALAMQRHVDRELARARVASAARLALSEPAGVIDRLLAVLRRTPEGARLGWRVDALPGLRARIDADDLTEALGALLENAARHARAAVEIRASRAGGRVVIEIADDGPGIPPELLRTLRTRGVRLDLAGPGAGLGLSIASEIAAAAGGALALENGRQGLIARLDLPAAPPSS